MANPGGDHTQQHFARLGHGHIDFHDLEGFLGFKGNGSAGLDHPGFSRALKMMERV
jgi:hypothetical protein